MIEPTGGPGVELTTLADAARFVGLLRSWRQAWPHWDYAAGLLLRAAATGKLADIEAATAQMERAYDVMDGFEMPHGSYSLGEAAANLNMIRIHCPKCHRSGQYRVDRLIEQYGPDIALPDLRHELAQCPHRRDMSNPCHVEYCDRSADL